MVHGFRVVAECFLGEAHRVAAFQRALGPRIAVRMEGHAFDVQTVAALLELGRAITGADGAEIREERSRLRPAPQQFRNGITEPNQRGFHDGLIHVPELAPGVADGARLPVDVFGQQVRGIALGRAGVPEEFVEVPAFGVRLARDDCEVLLLGDGSLALESGTRPEELGQDRFQQPFHSERVVVNAA